MCILGACSKVNENPKENLTQAAIQEELQIIQELLNRNEMNAAIEGLDDLQDVYPQNKEIAEFLAKVYQKKLLSSQKMALNLHKLE